MSTVSQSWRSVAIGALERIDRRRIGAAVMEAVTSPEKSRVKVSDGRKAFPLNAQAAQIASLQSQLNAAIAGTANNIPGVSPLNLAINNNPPQQSDVQPIADKLDQLINTLLRP